MKYIAIPDCEHCPHRDHQGGFGQVKYVPYCKKARRVLPHGVTYDDRSGRMYASLKPGIPSWCPLPELKKEDDHS